MWYQKASPAILEELKVKQDKGLSYEQAEDRLKTFGPNLLAKRKKESLIDIFVRQFKSPLIYILIFAAVLVLVLGQKIDAIVIIAVITINAIVGTIQEGRARNSLERLKSLTSYKSQVRRDKEETIILSEHVVPGDILILREGDRIPADARIISLESLKVDESILTGEAYSVTKTVGSIDKANLVLGDQKNMLFAGTSVASGYCEAVVVATGFESELGKISKSLLETSNVPLPLAQKVIKLTHIIAGAVFLIALLSFVLGILKGIPTREMFSTIVGLSVSIVPEGLPVAVTVVLAKGVWRMAKNKAIVRQMAAVEAMGNADTLLVDKTGTITTGNMVIRHILFEGEDINIGGKGYEPSGEISGGPKNGLTTLKQVLELTFLSLKADIIKQEHGNWKPIGDPTEAAIAVLCRKFSLSKETLLKKYKIVSTKPFDSQKRYIEASFSKGKDKWDAFIGAPEFLHNELKIDNKFMENYHNLAKKGLRVIGIAILGPKNKKVYSHLLLAIDEEIRPNVKESILEAKNAGFSVIMMTGDFQETAQAIAKKVGIFKDGDHILTGEDVEKLSENELANISEKTSVFARITPVHKLKIANAIKKNNHVVAMTGDGVNDGPALQAANLGIGLGSGTQVAKDASDIVLVNDNFSTIISAISEGRNIYLTLKKVILYLFSTSLAEVLIIIVAIILGLPLPLVAVQIIWLNFVTDGFFVVALAQEPPEPGLLSKTEVKSENLVDKLMAKRALLMGFTMLISTLPIFIYYQNDSLSHARSMALVVLSMAQWFNSLNVRSNKKSIFKSSLMNNPYLIGAFVAVVILQYLAIQTSFGNQLLHTVPLTIFDWVLAAMAASLIIFSEELRKLLVRIKSK